jgi:hypothetical protein
MIYINLVKVQGNFKVYIKYIFNILYFIFIYIYINRTLLGSIGNLTENIHNCINLNIQLF